MKKKVFEKYGEAVIANQLDIKLFEALGYHLPLSDEDEPDVITHPECSGQIIEATPVSPLTCTGINLVIVVPSPNIPVMLVPHAHTVPSLFNTIE